MVSRFGDALRTAALPLLAVSLTHRPLLIASVTACGYLPWIVFGLLGGAVADRVDQRRAMWRVDAVRGLLVAAFAVAVALGQASIPLLIALAFALTTLQTLFDNAATALLPALVDRSALGTANARLMTGQKIAGGLLGAPVVPALIVAGAAVPFAADAVTFLVAAALVASLRIPAPGGGGTRGRCAARSETGGQHPARGDRRRTAHPVARPGPARPVRRHRPVQHRHGRPDRHPGRPGDRLAARGHRRIRRRDHRVHRRRPGRGVLHRRITDRLGPLRAVLLAGLVQTGALVVMGTARSLAAVGAAMAAFGVMSMVWNVNTTTLMQQRAPTELLGRVSSAFRTLAAAGAPLGALLGGAVATAWGLNTPALLTAAFFVLSVLALIPAVKPDVPVVALEDDATTARVTG